MPLVFNLLLAYLFVGLLFGAVNYLVTRRLFEREGRGEELPADLLEMSLAWHALFWPSPVCWCLLCLVVMVLFPKRQARDADAR